MPESQGFLRQPQTWRRRSRKPVSILSCPDFPPVLAVFDIFLSPVFSVRWQPSLGRLRATESIGGAATTNERERYSIYRLCSLAVQRHEDKGLFMAKKITERDQAYWRANVRLITICLVIWATVSYGFGILLRPLVMGISVGGADLGFWFAQQGSILTFLALVFFYSWRMNRLDEEFGLEE